MKTKTILIAFIAMLALTAMISQSCKNYDPKDPTNPSPANNDTNVSVNTNLSWICADPDVDNLNYDIYFGTSSIPSKVEEYYTNTTYNPGTLEENATYYCYIDAFGVDNESNQSTSPVWGFSTIGSDLEWVNVTGGTFQMGSSNGGSDEQPIHSVTLSSFEITKYEVTNGQYCEFLNDIGCNGNGSHNGIEYINMSSNYCQINYSGGQFVSESGKTNFPVIEVSWYGSDAFAQWAGGRLPTEAEWEFAARGGNSNNNYRYSGSNTIGDVAWNSSNSGSHTHQVGIKATNELGLHDMSGNVWEWCNNWYDAGYYSSSPQNNPQGYSSGSSRVLRGGSWLSSSLNCRVVNRLKNEPDASNGRFGFRVAR